MAREPTWQMHRIAQMEARHVHVYTVAERAADAAKSEPPKGTLEVEQDVIDVQLNKQGALELLRQYANHPNNR